MKAALLANATIYTVDMCVPDTAGVSREQNQGVLKSFAEKTGGKFYPAGDEQTILNAIVDIDSRSGGRVDVKRYSTQRPKFAPYAFMATGFWSLALALQLTVPYFRKFP